MFFVQNPQFRPVNPPNGAFQVSNPNELINCPLNLIKLLDLIEIICLSNYKGIILATHPHDYEINGASQPNCIYDYLKHSHYFRLKVNSVPTNKDKLNLCTRRYLMEYTFVTSLLHAVYLE